MPTVTDITYTPVNTKYDNLSRDVTTYTIRAERTARDLDRHRTTAELAIDASEAAQHLLNNSAFIITAPTPETRGNRVDLVRTFINRLIHEADTAAMCVRQTERTVQELSERLTRANMHLLSTPKPEPITFTTAELRKKLAPLGATNIRIVRPNANTPYIKITFVGLTMKVAGNQYEWIRTLTDDGRIHVPLPPIDVQIPLNTNEEVKFPVPHNQRRNTALYPIAFSISAQVHPHILRRNGAACLGDFAGPIQEARAEYDIVTIASLIKMFLESCDASDPAGRYFPKWLKPSPAILLPNHLHHTSCTAKHPDFPQDNAFIFLLVDAHGNCTALGNPLENIWPAVNITSILASATPPPTGATVTAFIDTDDDVDDDVDDDTDDDVNNDEGYDVDGYDIYGYNDEGYDNEGYNHDGYTYEGYDRLGNYDATHDTRIYRFDGYDADGYNHEGYNVDGYNRLGYDRSGFNRVGYIRINTA